MAILRSVAFCTLTVALSAPPVGAGSIHLGPITVGSGDTLLCSLWNVSTRKVRVTRFETIIVTRAQGSIDPFDLAPGGITGSGRSSDADLPGMCIFEFGGPESRVRATACVPAGPNGRGTCKLILSGP